MCSTKEEKNCGNAVAKFIAIVRKSFAELDFFMRMSFDAEIKIIFLATWRLIIFIFGEQERKETEKRFKRVIIIMGKSFNGENLLS